VSAPRPPGPWLVSPAWDLALLTGPALLACGVAVLLPAGVSFGAVGWLVFVVGVDVAHVYGTLWRTLFDGEELRRHPLRYTLLPVATLAGLLALSLGAPGWFWTVLAYLAVFHFIRQQWGFAALYRLAEGLPGRSLDARVEKWAHYTVTGFPVLWWHAHLPRSFTWFTATDFLPGLPVAALWPAGALTAGIVGWHVVLRVRSGRLSWGRDLWLATTALVWWVGIVFTDADAAFTVTNVVAHGVPYTALIWLTGRRSWTEQGRGPATAALFHPAALALFLAPLLGLALAEELLWDRLVWLEHDGLFGDWQPVEDGLPAIWVRVAVAVLSLPQVVHYLLDGLIWRMGPDNARLRALFAPVDGMPEAS
jgi:hypothetical protein